MSQNISKCREGYREGEFATAAGRGGEAPYGWGGLPELSLHPAQVSPSRGLPESSFENQPVLRELLARVGPAEARVWPGALSAAPCCAQGCLAPSP